MGLMAKLAARASALLSPVVTGSGSVLPEVAAFMLVSRIGGRLTPAVLSGLILSADTGKVRRLVDLANEARQKDGHLQSVLFTRESALNNVSWVIRPALQPGKDEPLARDKRIAAFVQYAFDQIRPTARGRGLKDLIAHLNGAVFFGFSVAETNWHVVKGKLLPKEFILTAHRRFEYSQENGRLVWKDPGQAKGTDLQETWPAKFIQHQPRITGDVAMREGLMRVLLWLALFRSWTIADWMKLAELSWKPWRIAKYVQGSGGENKQAAVRILQALGSSGMAAHSENVELDVKFPEGGGATGNHGSLAAFLGGEMSKAVLGQTLTTEQGGVGSQALGKVHNEVRKDIRDVDAVAVAETIMRDLVAWIVYANFGDVPLPTFAFVTEDRVDLENFAAGIADLVDRGLSVGQNWVREEVGIPQPKDDEPTLTPLTSAAPDTDPDDDDEEQDNPNDGDDKPPTTDDASDDADDDESKAAA